MSSLAVASRPVSLTKADAELRGGAQLLGAAMRISAAHRIEGACVCFREASHRL